MIVVGVSCQAHDAALAIVGRGRIWFAGHAERYSRRKNDPDLSVALVDDALRHAPDPEVLALSERPVLKRMRQLVAGQYARALLTVRSRTYLAQFPLLGSLPIRYVAHHRAHAASGYFTSSFTDASIVVVDAIGEWNTISVWRADGRDLRKVVAVNYPHSLGLLYSAFTDRLGLKANEEEYITMGMAALGRPIYKDLILHDFFEVLEPPHLRLRRPVHRGIRSWRPEIEPSADLAASVQSILEDWLASLFRWVAGHLPSRNLVYTGGVALNCRFNGQLAKEGLFDAIWIMPNPGDAGASLGGALAVLNDWVEWPGPYLGYDIARPVDVEAAVRALCQRCVVAVASGRAEFGPRALGNRSLLADPRGPRMKDRMNVIKRRQPFRPFAPVVIERWAPTYFDMPVADAPYMQYAVRCRFPERYPAICHVDGTSRVQTVRHDQHPVLYELLSRFHSRTGCPMLLNTSLNIRGEPLVNTWDEAVIFSRLHDVALA
jgi:carbamoyltransferase